MRLFSLFWGVADMAARSIKTRCMRLSVVLLAGSPGAFAQDCYLLTCGSTDACEVAPARLTASLPSGLQIESIRGHTKVALRGEAATAECKAVGRLPQVVSADQASLYGAVQLKGRLKVSGVLRFEPNDGGALEFRPAKASFAATGKFFQQHFTRIKLDGAEPAVRVTPPPSLAQANCWQTPATAELSDFSVVVGDSSSAGTYAHKARVTSLDRFKQCTWGSE
jgi:hypothetical protein